VGRVADRDVVDATRRTRLANERTYLAWLRTGLTALAVAVGVGKIVPGVTDVKHLPFELLGAGFAVLAVAFVAYGALRFRRVELALDDGGFAPLGVGTAIAFAVGGAVLGVATIVFVFAN
jgi:putative membrane protein